MWLGVSSDVTSLHETGNIKHAIAHNVFLEDATDA